MSEKSIANKLLLLPSSLVIGAFVLVPCVLVLLASLASPSDTEGWVFALDPTNFARFFSWFYIERALFSIGLCMLVVVISLLLAYPFAYFLSGFSAKVKNIWLIYILAQLTLSEVLIAFSWQILLSRKSGLSNILVSLGLFDKPFSMTPSALGVLLGLVYLVIPFMILLLYPAFSRMDKSLVEAARTLGASPLRSFFTVVVPTTKSAIISSSVTVFVLTLGAVIVPQVLGSPKHWTLSVLIMDQAVFNSNVPFASALAVVLLVLSGGVIGSIFFFGKGKSA